ncbi:MAG TPA: AraC family transcriptional regulator [Deltaproteobacteria bacterium]|nr:AraC family transcriptional regulator [Deltaproteobacteria bacterium]HPR51461.1 AraC family transcriptional regulator [Deltaproteobacteria bacterium]
MFQDRMPSYSAKWLVRQLVSRGISLTEILRETDLSPAWLEDETALISQSQYLRLVGNALDETGDPALALHLGRQPNLGELGIWGYAIISSPTLGEANQVAMQFWELNGALVTIRHHKEGESSIWEIFPAFPMESLRLWIFAVEELLATFFSGCDFLTRQEFQIDEINLSYPDPGHGGLYREMFQCPVLFGMNRDLFRISFPFEDIPTSMGNPQLAAICKQQCQELMTKLRRSDELIGAIREAIIASLGQFPNLGEIAAHLAMSPRTLRRRLFERNTTYQHVLDEIRLELTKEYLTTTSLSVDQIASRLGFSEATTLRRAFRKWTGMTIKEFRKSR